MPNQQSRYAVIFISERTMLDNPGYDAMASKMMELAKRQSGFLGVESVRDARGAGITVSYWRSLEDINAWNANSEHQAAQSLGKDKWYRSFKISICKVEREYNFERDLNDPA